MIIKQKKKYALIIIGGGSAGIAAAISSARQNIKVALIEQRPVLGGNSSKEIGVHLTGSTRNVNTAYSRESGIIENLKLENLYQNPQGNLELWNVVLKNAVKEQKNLDVFLNTNITEVITDKSKIIKVKGDILGSEKKIEFKAPFFVDSTGDGTIGYLAGAKYRMGRESKNKYNESEAPEKTESYTMPSSLLFRIKKTNYPVDFIKPCWAYKFTEEDLENYNHKLQENKSHFSWIEWGGEHDIIKDNEEIRTELEKILYGIWDHLKNGSEHREKYK
ncbi:MAG: FAD-dependent oxidoreductase, partial [Candidatus Woesearchaeota archaeon]